MVARNMDADAAFISANAATYIASTNTTGGDQAPSQATLSPDEVCLRSLNAFLDYFLAMILQDSKSVELKELQATLTHLLDSPLGHVALQEAMAELETYKSQAAGQGRHFDEEEERAAAARKAADKPFNVEAVWAQARVRCMVYSTIGEREEADFPPLPENEHSVSPPVAIFLTAILEFLGEHILFTTARFARERLGQDVRGLMTHTDLDQGIRTDPVLATLWSDYWEIMPLSMQGKQPSPMPPSAGQFSNNVSPGQQYAERFLPSPAASSPVAPQYTTSLLPPADLGVQQFARAGGAGEVGTPVAMRKQSPAIEQQKRMQPAVEDEGDDKFARLQSSLGTALHFDNPQSQTAQQSLAPASPATGTYGTSPRKGVSIGVTQPRDVNEFASRGEPMTRTSSGSASLAETSTTYHAPTTTSDFDAFLRYEQLREQETKARATNADAQRLRIVAAREAALAESARETASTPVQASAPAASAAPARDAESPVLPAAQPAAPVRAPSPKPASTPTAATTAAARPLDPYDAYLNAPVRSSPRGTSGYEPRDATGSPVGEQTLRLAAFLRNTAPPGQVTSPVSPTRPEQSRNNSRKSVPLLVSSPTWGSMGASASSPGANVPIVAPSSPSASKSEPKVQRVKAQRSSVRRPIESGDVSDASTGGNAPTAAAAAAAAAAGQADNDAFRPDATRAESLADFLFNAPPPPAAVASPRLAGAEIMPPSNGAYASRGLAAGAAGVAAVGAAAVATRNPLQKLSTSSTTFVDDESVTTPTSVRKSAAGGGASGAGAGAGAGAGDNKMYMRPEDDTSRSSIYRVAHTGKRDRLRVTSLTEQRAANKTERELEDELLAGDGDGDDDDDEGMDELLGINRKKRNVESLADFLRNYTPPPATGSGGGSGSGGGAAAVAPTTTTVGGSGKRMANLGKRLSSMNFVKSRSTSAATNAEGADEAGAAAAKPSRPTHRPLIPSASIPNGASD